MSDAGIPMVSINCDMLFAAGRTVAVGAGQLQK